MKKISVANQKGGCGKTTTAISLSAALHDAGKSVLLVDLDPQAHATFGLGVKFSHITKSIYNLMTDDAEHTATADQVIVAIREKFDLIPGHILLSTIEQEFANKDNAVSRLNSMLDIFEDIYDYIVIDCPPGLGFLTFNALRAADDIVIPIETSAFSLVGVSKLLSMIELIRIKLNHSPHLKALVTMYDRRTKYSRNALKDIIKHFGDSLYDTIINVNIDLRKAVSVGEDIFTYNSRSTGAQDYARLAKEMIDSQKGGSLEDFVMHVEELNIQNRDQVRRFSFSGEANEVFVVGDFNNWSISDNGRLKKDSDGNWYIDIPLTEGKYHYKYVIDGRWEHDAKNPNFEKNEFGSTDSIIICR